MRQRPARDGRVLDGSARLRLSGAGQATRIRVIAEGAGKKTQNAKFLCAARLLAVSTRAGATIREDHGSNLCSHESDPPLRPIAF